MKTDKSTSAINKKIFDIVKDYGVILFIVLLIIIFGLINPKFLTVKNLTSLLTQVVPIGIMTLGAAFVLISGGIDLSAGIAAGLAAVIIGLFLNDFQNTTLGIIVMFAGMIILGLANGFLVSFLRLGSVIATLILMTVLSGLIYVIAAYRALIVEEFPFFLLMSRGKLLGIPYSFLVLIVIYFLGYVILNHTKVGFYILAIGNNEEGARVAGINVLFWKFIPYVISSICAGIGSIFVITRTMRVDAEVGGTSLLLNAIAAAIIGGVSIKGGKGTIRGVVIGAFTIAIINNAVLLMPIHPAWNEFFKGAVIIIVIVFDRIVNVFEERRVKIKSVIKV